MTVLVRAIVAGLAIGFSSPALSADDPATTYQSCLDNSTSSQQMINCAYAAQDAWDKVLNKNYKAAMDVLDKDQQEALRTAQRTWLAYRDADSKFRNDAWQFGDGLDAKLFLAEAGVDVIKQRAQLLGTYADPTGEN